jgi:hypothetical protein
VRQQAGSLRALPKPIAASCSSAAFITLRLYRRRRATRLGTAGSGPPLHLLRGSAPARNARHPLRRNPCWSWFSPGTEAATLLWLLGSAEFSFYVAQFSSYDRTCGSLGAVVILLMRFDVSAFIVLTGAEFNSEYEKARQQTAELPPRR